MKEPKKAVDYICKGWTKKTLARNPLGIATAPRSLLATKWCAMGAIEKAYPNPKERHEAQRKLQAVLGPYTVITNWNDSKHRTKKEVVEAFCKAGI